MLRVTATVCGLLDGVLPLTETVPLYCPRVSPLVFTLMVMGVPETVPAPTEANSQGVLLLVCTLIPGVPLVAVACTVTGAGALPPNSEVKVTVDGATLSSGVFETSNCTGIVCEVLLATTVIWPW